ncbi:MAG: lipid-A-disaccharide synthase [Acetobacteraceae bacterium]|nr:lipid-A-disaccharide synthase [Acetobacteraceae bacterium]MDW8397930.1 lipid-A-disaccharide synthase [Acetobacteraceae bacterium]
MSGIHIVAGEASGDILGARLVAALRRARPDLSFSGIGGPAMAAEGIASPFPIGDLALMGFAEVVPKLPLLRRRMAEAVAQVQAVRPAVVVTVDSPGFTLRLAKRIKPIGIPIIHYVAPQVWAWRPGRVRRIARLVDRLLCLLPFEPEIFRAAGLDARFVGHPVLEAGAEAGDAARFAARHGLSPEETPLIVMPGSRGGEVRRLLPVFGAAVARLTAARPGLRPVIPLAPAVAGAVAEGVRGWPGRPILLPEAAEKPDAYAAARAAGGVGLIKSGTSSLEVAAGGVPMVVAYRVNPLSAAIARRLIRVRFASLVNILADEAVIPEYLQERCTPPLLADALAALLADPAARSTQATRFAALLAALRPPEGSPSEAAAAAVLELLPRR